MRKRRYEKGIHPETIGRRFAQQKDLMSEQEGVYFSEISDVERKVKQVVEAAGVSSIQVAQYINVGRQCYSLAKRFSQATRDAEAQHVVDHWAARGLDGPLLAAACLAGGCNVTDPAAVCYLPCVHGNEAHDPDFVQMATGRYHGDGTAAQAITGVGFQPRFVMIWVHATVSLDGPYAYGVKIDQFFGTFSFYVDGASRARPNQIISLDVDGFTVGDDGVVRHPNYDCVDYDWICLG